YRGVLIRMAAPQRGRESIESENNNAAPARRRQHAPKETFHGPPRLELVEMPGSHGEQLRWLGIPYSPLTAHQTTNLELANERCCSFRDEIFRQMDVLSTKSANRLHN